MQVQLPYIEAFSAPKIKPHVTSIERRDIIVKDASRRHTIKSLATLASITSTLVTPGTDQASYYANAAPNLPFGKGERRQLELCIVSILRIKYWAETVALSIERNIENTPKSGISDVMKAPYLEARLGAKAALTGRAGGGSNAKVYTLKSIQLRDCVKDGLSWYYELYNRNMKGATTSEQKADLKKQRFFLENAADEIIESLASIVEFDGLDNTLDPSPRSSLALTMYNESKATFVKRTLQERTLPSCDTFVNAFGSETREICIRFIQSTYASEVPPS